jgi:hypothetical protein
VPPPKKKKPKQTEEKLEQKPAQQEGSQCPASSDVAVAQEPVNPEHFHETFIARLEVMDLLNNPPLPNRQPLAYHLFRIADHCFLCEQKHNGIAWYKGARRYLQGEPIYKQGSDRDSGKVVGKVQQEINNWEKGLTQELNRHYLRP